MAAGYLATILQDFSVDVRKTQHVIVPDWAEYGKVFIPAITNGAVTMEAILKIHHEEKAANLTADVDTNWKVVYDSAESNQVAASGVENCWIDISSYIQGLPHGTAIRFVVAADQGADTTWYVSFRG